MQSLHKEPCVLFFATLISEEEWVNRKKGDREKVKCTVSLEEAAWELSQRSWPLWRTEGCTVPLQSSSGDTDAKTDVPTRPRPAPTMQEIAYSEAAGQLSSTHTQPCWNTQETFAEVLSVFSGVQCANAEEMQMGPRTGLVMHWPITLLDASNTSMLKERL